MADGERTGGAGLRVGRPEPPENGPSTQPAISADGRHVAFRSPASNLVDDDGNGFDDVFVHDRLTGTTERVSVTSDGSEGASVSSAPSIDGSGTRVVFESSSVLVSPGDGNSLTDVYQRDFDTGTTMLVSSFSNGVAGNFVSREPTISADGSTIAFASSTAFSVDDPNGAYVSFRSFATNLVPGDGNGQADVFRARVTGGPLLRVSQDYMGDAEANGSSGPSTAIADAGQVVAFPTSATNLAYQLGGSGWVPDPDTNGGPDVVPWELFL